ncbi:MAG: copper resistance protein NlpE [Candidatus Azobacteroides sp.]|nr:copper resistance protein NlpE [Candidatus Azobacteroides sp.]
MNNNQSLMTKIWIVAAMLGILCSCGGNASKTKTSSDYEGTYTGTLPTASGMGMTVTITLKDGAYTKRTEYVGKDGVFEDKGKYTLNREENIITLDGINSVDSPNKYAADGNTLTQLDMEGNRITGELADQYVLQKELK